MNARIKVNSLAQRDGMCLEIYIGGINILSEEGEAARACLAG